MINMIGQRNKIKKIIYKYFIFFLFSISALSTLKKKIKKK